MCIRDRSNTVFDSFVWPQKPTENDVKKVAKAALEYRLVRKGLTEKYQLTLRELHRQLEVPGENSLKKVQEKLDIAVRGAFKIGKNVDFLEFMLSENSKAFDMEKKGDAIEIAGLPSFIEDRKKYISDDCILP